MDFKPQWLLAMSLALCASLGQAQTSDIIQGRVIAVADGDTLTVLDAQRVQHKIRLAEIDAPEKAQPFGQVAKQSLADMCFQQEASVEVVTIDRYKRIVGKVRCNRKDANLLQVRYGMAWAYRQYKPSAMILFAEEQARAAHTGLWSDAHPTPPWEWRRAK